MPFPIRRFATLLILILTALVAGCASRTAPRVTWLGDGVFKSPTAQEAEAYCRNFGAPMRFLDPKGPGVPAGEVTYRCD
ncbi:hypothetical protein QTH90_10900 [Variovorax sp. J2P1-59]|uniref:hypothetical protein n=1 Tax=Variovorax flavidus TaxID=3053501 RepID=UPI00257504D0|nr:hypothetical protein [Variovorax sp. J2P1-59]MDM0074891.1 hypothetical protein [Variovorax sp. J2P1-59]